MTAKCQSYKSSRLTRFGKTKAGKQKLRCLDCGRQFVEGSDHLIDPETREIMTGLQLAGVKPSQIAKAVPRISLRWIYNLRKQVKP